MSNFPWKDLVRVACAAWYSWELQWNRQGALTPLSLGCPQRPKRPHAALHGGVDKAVPAPQGPGLEGMRWQPWGATLWPRLWLSQFCLTSWFSHPFPGCCGGLPPPPGSGQAPNQRAMFLEPQARVQGWQVAQAHWSSLELVWQLGRLGLLSWEHGNQGLSISPAPGLRLFTGTLGPRAPGEGGEQVPRKAEPEGTPGSSCI